MCCREISEIRADRRSLVFIPPSLDEMAGDGVAPAVPEKDKSKSSLLPSLRLQSLDELLVGAVLKAGPTGTSGTSGAGGFRTGDLY